MHKCNALPPFVTDDGLECMANLETGLLNETDCINWNLYYTDCKPGEVNPFSGAISFDNIGLAWVAIFLVSCPDQSRVASLGKDMYNNKSFLVIHFANSNFQNVSMVQGTFRLMIFRPF